MRWPSTLRGWLAFPLVLLVRGYQLVISPLLPQSCRYYPSCSAYAVTSLERFGALKGTWLAGHRLLRCNPWSAGGVDHVPEHWEDRPRFGRPSKGAAPHTH